MKIKIDKDVQAPKEARGAKPKYPLAEMKVGDSFFFKPATQWASKSPYQAARRLGIKIRCAAERNGYRVWRVK